MSARWGGMMLFPGRRAEVPLAFVVRWRLSPRHRAKVANRPLEHMSAGPSKYPSIMDGPTSQAGRARVAIRARPLNALERAVCNNKLCVDIDPNQRTLVLKSDKATSSYDFDFVGGPETSQEEIFERIMLPIIYAAFNGQNGTVFAYGQTGSGKSYTIAGEPTCPVNMGILPRSFVVMEQLIKDKAEQGINVRCEVTFVQLYLEKFSDLLQTSKKTDLKLAGTDGASLPYVAGATVVPCTTSHQFLDVLECGNVNRTTSGTSMNKQSSRSHAIFTTKITTMHPDGRQIVSVLNVVDLAGSESSKKSHTVGKRRTEGNSINKSLLALNTVIFHLAQEEKHVPFRNSQLTHFLSKSIGGNAQTVMICNISVCSSALAVTSSTIKVAASMGNIKGEPKVNTDMSNVPKWFINEQQAKEEGLLKRIAELEAKGASAQPTESKLVEALEVSCQRFEDVCQSLHEVIKTQEHQAQLYKDACFMIHQERATLNTSNLRLKNLLLSRDEEIRRLRSQASSTSAGKVVAAGHVGSDKSSDPFMAAEAQEPHFKEATKILHIVSNMDPYTLSLEFVNLSRHLKTLTVEKDLLKAEVQGGAKEAAHLYSSLKTLRTELAETKKERDMAKEAKNKEMDTNRMLKANIEMLSKRGKDHQATKAATVAQKMMLEQELQRLAFQIQEEKQKNMSSAEIASILNSLQASPTVMKSISAVQKLSQENATLHIALGSRMEELSASQQCVAELRLKVNRLQDTINEQNAAAQEVAEQRMAETRDMQAMQGKLCNLEIELSLANELINHFEREEETADMFLLDVHDQLFKAQSAYVALKHRFELLSGEEVQNELMLDVDGECNDGSEDPLFCFESVPADDNHGATSTGCSGPPTQRATEPHGKQHKLCHHPLSGPLVSVETAPPVNTEAGSMNQEDM